MSVVVPFAGGAGELRRLRVAIERLELDPADEVVVADNGGRRTAAPLAGGRVRVVAAEGERSSYHARNAGARGALGEWLLFMDADCSPAPGLLDAYLGERPPARVGALAGEIVCDPAQRSFVARYIRSRRVVSQSEGLLGATSGVAAAGNLLVRRTAFEALDGFCEGIRSGGDIDLCRRLAAAGWTLEYRPAALVEHRHRDTLVAFLRTVARYGAGSRWLNERYPGTSPPWPLGAGLAGALRDIARLGRRGLSEDAAFRALDGLGLVAHAIGYRSGNAAPPALPPIAPGP